MKRIKFSENGRNTLFLGGMCSIAYLAVYIARNILSAVSPQMIESGLFSKAQIGAISSAFFFTYAIGQLVNGIIGDKIRPKLMIGFGLVFAGLCNILFSIYSSSLTVVSVSYGAMGFFLSMIFGPMTRLVSENLPLEYATRASISYNFMSFFGSPVAGLLAAFFLWQTVFHAGSALLILMGILCLLIFTSFEKKGVIKKKVPSKKESRENIGIRGLLKRDFIKFTLISFVTGIIRTTVVFWMPTYFSEKLGFSSGTSAVIFTVTTTLISFNAFVAIGIYKLLKKKMNLTLLLSFGASTLFFALLFVVKNPFLNIAFLVLGILTNNCAASMLWSIYCPGLADTGLVSGATGFLDFVSYMAAAVSSILFGNAVSTIGWNALILTWAALMLFGTLLCVPLKKRFAR